MPNSARFPLNTAPFALSALSALCVGGASAEPLHVAVSGLPAGLSTELMAMRETCPTAKSPRQLENFQVVPLMEKTIANWVRVQLPDGNWRLIQRLSTTYNAQAEINPNGPCGAPEFLSFRLRVLGERTATSLERRDANLSHQRLADGTISISGPVQAFSDTLRKRDPVFVNVAFTQLARGVFHEVSARHANPFGNESVGAPVLEFVKPPLNPLGFSTITRMFISLDGSKCIGAGSTTKCYPGSALQEGLLVHGGIALSPGSTTLSQGYASFRFRLNDDFQVGEYILKARADDLDSIDYLVDGIPTPLNLINWIPVSQTVQIVN